MTSMMPTTVLGELREHPVDHRPPIEVGRRCWRFRTASGGGGLTDRTEQGKPELLGVVLIALHLHDGEPVRLTRTVGPSAQQRRLPAARRSRDDRHLPRRRAIQSGEKITPADQPGLCPIHRQEACLGAYAGRPPSATQSSRYQASARSVNGARITRIR